MVQEAQKFADEDKANSERIEARNTLENFTFSMRATLDDPEVQNGVSQEDRQKIQAAVSVASNWLESNQEATKEEYMAQAKAIESVAHPILSEFYKKRVMEAPPSEGAAAAQQQAEGDAAPGGEPHTEDVD
ncbi:hypothetical protein JKF63_04151 [Porcisia hertigi]|uniref:Heat shock protein 70 n=1 Tax=Porcisia hertigi TaxID=2761500 RepID=A0A836INI6_9TRYP|nr:hypothetical protein JKF63_04151 [Porcisia hertigi]